MGHHRKFFTTFNITFVPRYLNQLVDSLATSSRAFKALSGVKASYEIQIKYRSSILDNIKHWKMFQDDQEIKSFLECV